MNYKTVLPAPLRILISVVNRVADQLAKLNNSNPVTYAFKFNATENPSLIYFDTFYLLFKRVLTEKKVDTPPVPTTVPPASILSSPSAESTSSSAKSTSTGVSKAKSTTSGDSKAEHYTHDAAAHFLLNTFQTARDQIEKLASWSEGQCCDTYELRIAVFVPVMIWLIIRQQQDTKVKLGPKDSEGRSRILLVAKSDGGCSFATSIKFDCSFAAIPVEVMAVALVVAADFRLNVRKPNCWTKEIVIRRIRKRLKNVIRIMLPRFMRKCWV
jgi:hypothetical protein